MTAPSACLGDLLSALVDGELDHAARERALVHLAGCAACRADVEDQRRLKVRLATLAADAPSAELSSRLLALSVPGVEPAARPTAPQRPVTVRSARGPAGAARPASRRHGRGLRRAAAVGGSFVVAGMAAALVLGGRPAGGASTPIDPGADVFVVEHVSTTSELPLREPVGAATVPRR